MSEQGASQQQPGLAVCYRHPDRQTGIRCTRCERPICPDCMIDAAVGYQCPECVRGAHTPQPRTLAGGTLHRDTRLVTKVLIGLNLAVFVAVLAAGEELRDRLLLVGLANFSSSPFQQELGGVADGEWYRLLTSAFLHEQIWHIGFNMLVLWVIGSQVEAMLGRSRYLVVYVLSALAGSTLFYLLAAANQPALGASGAVFGLFGAWAVLARRLRADMRPIVTLLGLNLVITFLPGTSIAWQAHLGGLVAGAVLTFGMVHAPRGMRMPVQVATCGAVLLITVIACAVRTSQLLG